MQALARILLQMQPFNADSPLHAFRQVEHDFALADNRQFELGNLIALRQIRIEIVLPGKDGPLVDLGVESKTRAHRLLNTILVENWQHARHGGIDKAHLRIGISAELGRRTREQL